MGVSRTDRPDRRRGDATPRDPEPLPAPELSNLGAVSNHLLASALAGASPPAGAMLQRIFKYKDKDVPPAKLPSIYGVKEADLKKLAADPHPYGDITDPALRTAALDLCAQKNAVAKVLPPLDQVYAGYQTVWTNEEFTEHDGQTVRAIFQLDAMQGKHDAKFAGDKDARKKGGGEQMPEDSDYETLAQGVPADLTTERLADIFAKRPRTPLDFSVQKVRQWDGYHYEISAAWDRRGEDIDLVVYYHCYPPRK